MECKKRKKMCMEMLNHLADGMELKVANVMVIFEEKIYSYFNHRKWSV